MRLQNLGLLLFVAYVCQAGAQSCTSSTFGSLGILNADLSTYHNRSFSVGEHSVELPTNPQLCGMVPDFLAQDGDTTADTNLLFDACKANCQETDVPLMAGLGFFGFNLEDSLEVCFDATTTMDEQTELFCSSGEATICPLAQSTEDVVTKLTELNYATLAKASKVLDLLEQARAQALDSANAQLIQFATTEDTPKVIRGIYAEILSVFGNVSDYQGQQMVALRESFNSLKTSFDAQYEDFVRALEVCNQLVPRTDDDNNILYDICSQKSTLCIEEEQSAHVSCCCAYNPLSQMPGLNLDTPSDPSSCVFFDICSETLEQTNEASVDLELDIEDGVFNLFKAKVEEAYTDFFQEPTLNTGSEFNISRYLSESTGTFPGRTPTGCSEKVSLSHNGYFSDMIYDFDGNVEDNHCSDRFGNSNEGLYDRCEAFCGAYAIPLLVGTDGSPVGLDTAEAVCFDSSLVGTASDLEFCRSTGKAALGTLQEKLADFVAKQMIFRYGKLLFLGVLRDYAAQARAAASSDEFFDEIQNANNDAEAKEFYIAFFRELFSVVTDQEAFLVSLAELVEESFTDLKDSFDDLYDDLTRYTQVCLQTFPKTTDDQSILAVCPVRGTACADEVLDNYVFCCCAQNPTLDLVADGAFDTCTAAKAEASDVYITITSEGNRRQHTESKPSAIVDKMVRNAEKIHEIARSPGRRSGTMAYFNEHQRMLTERYGDNLVLPVPNSMLPQKDATTDDDSDDTDVEQNQQNQNTGEEQNDDENQQNQDDDSDTDTSVNGRQDGDEGSQDGDEDKDEKENEVGGQDITNDEGTAEPSGADRAAESSFSVAVLALTTLMLHGARR